MVLNGLIRSLLSPINDKTRNRQGCKISATMPYIIDNKIRGDLKTMTFCCQVDPESRIYTNAIVPGLVCKNETQ